VINVRPFQKLDPDETKGNRYSRDNPIRQRLLRREFFRLTWTQPTPLIQPTTNLMKSNSKLGATAKTFDAYLGALSAEKRAALEKLRKTIRAAVPKAEECISYGIPAFRLNGKFLVGMGAGANHCSFYPGSTLQAYKSELKKFDTSKGTIRFQPDSPLPAALVRKLVKARIAQTQIS
jgi:uncharacterized protein YdhG (YjbR/CyaY superfamily)